MTNITAYANMTNFGEVVTVTNDATAGWLMHGYLFAFFVIMFMIALRKGETKALILVDGFLTTLQSLLMLFASWIPLKTVYFMLGLFAMTILWYIFGED